MSPEAPSLWIALPSKGMEEETLRFLDQCGLTVERSGQRQYRASLAGLPQVAVVFQRAADIYYKVAESSVDLGITGYDILRERQQEEGDVLCVYKGLGYGRCSLVLAVPETWVDVSTVGDLAELAEDMAQRGNELRVATKYVNLAREFLLGLGVRHFSIVESQGAVEAAPAIGHGDVVIDLTTTGNTLRENRLKPVTGGAILDSEACLIGNRRSLAASPDKLALTRSILERAEAYLKGRDYCSVTANIPGASYEEVARRVTPFGELAGLRGPTVARVYPRTSESLDKTLVTIAPEGATRAGERRNREGGPGWFAVTVVVSRRRLQEAVDALRKAGASEVTVTALSYVFESKCWSYEALKRKLA